LYLTAERRLRHVHTLSRSPKMQILRDGKETSQLTELEH
jgi:hypothetical protein